MPGVPSRYEETFRTLQSLTAQVHRMMESGEFHALSLRARRKLLRSVKRLYNRLAGPVPSQVLVGAVAAGVLFLAGCFQPTATQPDPDPEPDPGPDPEPPVQVFVPAFTTPAQVNPYGIGVVNGDVYLQMQPVFADLDADGDPDLVFPAVYAAYYGGYYHYAQWHQDGALSFDPIADAGIWRSDGPYGSNRADLKAFVDIDNDGDLDAVLSGQYNYYAEGILLAENTGTASAPLFANPVKGPFTNLARGYVNDRAVDAAFADIDGDGDQDLLYIRDIAVGADELTFSLNVGTAALADFSTPQVSPYADPTLSYYSFHSVEAADIDNDGDVDLLIGSYYSNGGTTEARLLFYENTGTPQAPAFAARVVNPFGLSFPGTYAWGMSASAYMGGVGVAAADIDGDGDLDLLIGPDVSYVSFYVYQSSFLFFENTGTMVDVQ